MPRTKTVYLVPRNDLSPGSELEAFVRSGCDTYGVARFKLTEVELWRDGSCRGRFSTLRDLYAHVEADAW